MIMAGGNVEVLRSYWVKDTPGDIFLFVNIHWNRNWYAKIKKLHWPHDCANDSRCLSVCILNDLYQWFSTGGARPPGEARTLSWGGTSRLQVSREKKKKESRKFPPYRNASGWTIITHTQIIPLATTDKSSDFYWCYWRLLWCLETLTWKHVSLCSYCAQRAAGAAVSPSPVQKHSQAVSLSVASRSSPACSQSREETHSTPPPDCKWIADAHGRRRRFGEQSGV